MAAVFSAESSKTTQKMNDNYFIELTLLKFSVTTRPNLIFISICLTIYCLIVTVQYICIASEYTSTFKYQYDIHKI